MNAAKKIILLLWLAIVASLGNVSASTPGATENRTWEKSFSLLETRQAKPLQTLGRHQENEGAGYDYAPDSLLAAKGEKLLSQFTGSTIDEVVASAGQARSSQITEGARAIAKKLGHAESGGYTSAFQGIAPTQANAEALIQNIMSNPSRTFYGAKVIDIYNAAGQGVRINAQTRAFETFLEASRATQ